jgi:hypothetical protein
MVEYHCSRQSAHRWMLGFRPYAFNPLPPKIPGTYFFYSVSQPQGHSAAGKVRKIEKKNPMIFLLLLWSKL